MPNVAITSFSDLVSATEVFVVFP